MSVSLANPTLCVNNELKTNERTNKTAVCAQLYKQQQKRTYRRRSCLGIQNSAAVKDDGACYIRHS